MFTVGTIQNPFRQYLYRIGSRLPGTRVDSSNLRRWVTLNIEPKLTAPAIDCADFDVVPCRTERSEACVGLGRS